LELFNDGDRLTEWRGERYHLLAHFANEPSPSMHENMRPGLRMYQPSLGDARLPPKWIPGAMIRFSALKDIYPGDELVWCYDYSGNSYQRSYNISQDCKY
jgi:hypothetical protein